jgi:glycosyltransferase involved in cell wall biosynthesis
VNDHSTDRSSELIAAFAQNSPVPVLQVAMPDVKHGAAAARNLGAASATGDYLLFIDADVVVEADATERIADLLLRENYAAVVADFHDHSLQPGILAHFQADLVHTIYQGLDAEESPCLGTHCAMIRRDTFESSGGFNEQYASATVEDFAFGYCLRAQGLRIAIARHALIWHNHPYDLRSFARNYFSKARDLFHLVAGPPEARSTNGGYFAGSNAIAMLLIALSAIGLMIVGVRDAHAAVIVAICLAGIAVAWRAYLSRIWKRAGFSKAVQFFALRIVVVTLGGLGIAAALCELLKPKRRAPRWPALAFVGLLTVVGVVRIVSGYGTFSQWSDETGHIGCGLEWWQLRTCILDKQHPPLSRIAIAAGLYFRGTRLADTHNPWISGVKALGDESTYSRNLALARMGILPFFVTSCWMVYVIGYRIAGHAAGIVAVLLHSTMPAILGFAGLAYTDMPLTAAILFFSWRWLEFNRLPDLRNAIWVGVSVAASVLSKYSAIPYISVAILITVVLRLFQCRPIRITAPALSAAIAIAFLLTWSGFRFSFRPAVASDTFFDEVDRATGNAGFAHDAVRWAFSVPLPMPELVEGIGAVRRHALDGHWTYAFGERTQRGRWYYFPVILLITIPVTTLILIAVGGGYCAWRKGTWKVTSDQVAVTSVPLAVLTVNAFSTINIGVRHGLALHPFAALLAGCLAEWLWREFRHRPWARAAVAAMLVGHVVSSVSAHPDYATYTNILAGSHPERICLHTAAGDGDLFRLSSRLKQLGIERVELALPGLVRPEAAGIRNYAMLEPQARPTGWVAASIMAVRVGSRVRGDYPWLERFNPVEKVGRSLLLYHIPPGESSAIAGQSGSSRVISH